MLGYAAACVPQVLHNLGIAVTKDARNRQIKDLRGPHSAQCLVITRNTKIFAMLRTNVQGWELELVEGLCLGRRVDWPICNDKNDFRLDFFSNLAIETL